MSSKPGKEDYASTNRNLWIAQWLLAVTFIGAGVWKLVTPLPELAKAIPWAGQVSPQFVYFIGVVDLLGGFGLILPSLTGILPKLTVAAAVGCFLLMVSAVVFHFMRGEFVNTIFNFMVMPVCLYIADGRYSKAPIGTAHGNAD